jgi:hypothetical protein
MASRDLATIRASLAARATRTMAPAEEASIVAAISQVAKMPWLFGRLLRQVWMGIAGLLVGVDRRKTRAGLAVLTGVAVLSIGLYFMRTHGYAYWQETVSPVVGEAILVQQRADVIVRLAAGVGIAPLGASAHAEGALIEINKLNVAMRQLMVTSMEPDILQSTFAEHPDASQVATHDRTLIRLARQHLQLARNELDKADKVLLYAKKWHDIDPYAALPDGLSPKWSTEVGVMSDALNSGDLQKIEQADLQLDNIRKGGEMAEEASHIVGRLSADDRAIASPYQAIIDDAVVHADPDKARQALARLTMMREQLPLSYSLYLLSIPGEKSFVVEQDAHDASVRHDCLIVQATDAQGAPVAVSIHDSRLDKDTDAERFGIEVGADTFEQIRTQHEKDDSVLLVGRKSAGTVATSFALPVLDGRIAHW